MARAGWIGQTLGGRYLIEEELGHGGMASVYKATDANLRRTVAVKLVHSHYSTDPEFVRRFEAEATAVAQLRHPHIVQVYDFNHDGESYYIVFEFVPGETLQAYMKRLADSGRRMSESQTVAVSTQIADALQYAHERGLVHRDVKPANVMINVQGQAILTDFGIVKIVGGTQHTAAGAVLGTARYMSPEQIKGQQIDYRTDIYSLGVMLFEMVGSRPPFDAESAMTVMMMHVSDPVPDVRQLRPDVSPQLAATITRALAKEPDARFRSTAELSQALAQAGRGSSTVAPTVADAAYAPATAPAGRQAAAPATRPPTTPPRPTTAPRQSARRPAAPAQAPKKQRWPIFVAGGVMVLFLLCLGIFLAITLLGGSDDENQNGTLVAGMTLEAEQTAAPVIVPTTDEFLPPEAPPVVSPTQPATTAAPTALPATPTLRQITAVPPTDAAPTTAPTAVLPTTAPPTAVPPTAPAALSVRITGISIQGGRYVVTYETAGYTETLPGTHIHFFFDTVSEANAGVPGSGPWILYGGPRPFSGYGVADRPGAAGQMCARVANADHSIQLGSGNCMALPPG